MKYVSILFFLILTCPGIVWGANGPGKRIEAVQYRDANGDGKNDLFRDADGDGVNDVTGKPYPHRFGFADMNGDGVNDSFRDANGDGINDMAGKQTPSTKRGTSDKNSGKIDLSPSRTKIRNVDRFSDSDGDGINDDREPCSKNCGRFKDIEERRTRRK